MIQLSLGCVVNWLGRTAQWLGGVYLLLAAAASLRESHLPLLPQGKESRPAHYRYGVAIAIVLAATALRLVFLTDAGDAQPLLVVLPRRDASRPVRWPAGGLAGCRSLRAHG